MKTIIILNSVKSRYFMLVVCVTLLLGVSACSSEEFGIEVLEAEKELTIDELIEQALIKLPQANDPFPVLMVTTKKEIRIRCLADEDVVVFLNGESSSQIIKNDSEYHTYTFSTDSENGYVIFLQTSPEAIRELGINDNDLIRLNVKNNINLKTLDCTYNKLTELDLTGCSNLELLFAQYNNISSIDVSYLSNLIHLSLDYNQIENIDISNNLNIKTLSLKNNQITSLDLSNNRDLRSLSIGKNSITNLDLRNNTLLNTIEIDHLPVYTLNNDHINGKSLSLFSRLTTLDISNTPFASLDLSQNSFVRFIKMDSTAISYLDISHLQIDRLSAYGSNLTEFIYSENSLFYCTNLEIKNTPFATDATKLFYLLSDALPDRYKPYRYGDIRSGYLRTNYLPIIDTLLPYMEAKNWRVYY